MRQSIIDGASDAATELAQQALANGIDPLEAVNLGFAAGITFAGDQFGCGQMFLPDLLASAEAMKAAINILEPEMLKRGSQRETLGKIVLGTARGDIHDIGKNLVATILSACLLYTSMRAASGSIKPLGKIFVGFPAPSTPMGTPQYPLGFKLDAWVNRELKISP